MGPLRLEKCQVVAFRGNLPQIVLLVAVFAFWPNAGYADPINWNISISNPNQSGPPGSTLVFDGVITNNTGGDLIFDTVKIPFATSVSPSSFVKDFSDGFLSTLGIIPASGYYDGRRPRTGSSPTTSRPPTAQSSPSPDYRTNGKIRRRATASAPARSS